MNKKGFLLLDSLVSVVIVATLCLLCASTYQNVSNYYDGYHTYKNRMKEEYENIYSMLGVCEKCIIEEDLLVLEQ